MVLVWAVGLMGSDEEKGGMSVCVGGGGALGSLWAHRLPPRPLAASWPPPHAGAASPTLLRQPPPPPTLHKIQAHEETPPAYEHSRQLPLLRMKLDALHHQN